MSEKMEGLSPRQKKQKLDRTRSSKSKEDSRHSRDVYEQSESSNSCGSDEDSQKIRVFKILDEVNSEDSNVQETDSSDDDILDKSKPRRDCVPDEEIEKMLEENLPDNFKKDPKPEEKKFTTRSKIVLEEKGVNKFEALPLDWMMAIHHSGMPIYVHKTTRVCTLSKPYFLGEGNIRRHDIPLSAIPCLAYKRALEEEEKQKEIDRQVNEQIKNLNQSTDAALKIFPAKKNSLIDKFIQNKQRSFSSLPTSTQSKCPIKRLDKDNTVEMSEIEEKKVSENVAKSEVANKNSTTQNTKQTASSNEEVGAEAAGGTDPKEGLPHSSSLLDRRSVILPSGEIMIAPRVESVHNNWKTKNLTPEQLNNYCKSLFQFKTVNVMQFTRWADRRNYARAQKAMQYPKLPEGTKLITLPAPSSSQDKGGKGVKRDWVMNLSGVSCLSVFHEYVSRTLQKQPVYEYKQIENSATPYQATVLIGGMQYGVGEGTSKRQAKYAAARASIQILIPEMREHMDVPADQETETDSFFDYITIEDPRIAEFCAATCEPSPHAVLRTCLLRNFGASDRHVHTEMKKIACSEVQMTMKVGKHSATVVCKNKKTAKQRASQALLQALHPHLRSWGSLLRLYGSKAVKSSKEKKLEEQQITLLQDQARQNEPNYAVLEKLRSEMRKLRERDLAVVPIGTLMVTDEPPTQSGSNLNNVDM